MSHCRLLLHALGALLLSFGVAHAQTSVDVGDCTPGDLKCVDDSVLLVCECYDDVGVVDGVEQAIVVCVWEHTGDACGQPPPPVRPPACTEAYAGATFDFVDEVKECTCSPEVGCRWTTHY